MYQWNEIVEKHITKNFNKINKVTQPLKEHFGIDYFTYHRIDASGKYIVLVDRPDYAEHYVSEKIYLLDPFLKHPKNYQTGVHTTGTTGTVEYQARVSRAMRKILSTDTSVMMIFKQEDFVEFFGFVGNKEKSCLEKLYLNHQQLLRSYTNYFKDQLKKTIDSVSDVGFLLSELKGKDYDTLDKFEAQLSQKNKLAYLKDIGMGDLIEKWDRLSPRERQCLTCLLEDKTAKETAVKFGISARTIEKYFETIKGKLMCWDKQEVKNIAKILREHEIL